MQQGSPQQRNDSDNDEGFVVNVVEIKHKQKPKVVVSNTTRPTDYQPRYLNGNTLIRKQLPEIINSLPHFPSEESIQSPKIANKKDRENISKIQQHTFPNKNYDLVYQRNNKRVESDSINTQNNINLTSIINYSADNYSILKNWDLKSNNQDLIFQSRFQCGNLLYAYKCLASPNHYVLFLHNDTNTNGYNKWFYFAVKNQKKLINYTFSIVNYRKNLAFIKQGMKPTRFSLKQQEARGNGWSRCFNKVGMYRSKINEDSQLLSYNEHYTLTFEVSFDYENDTNFFSLIPPYSYSKLINFLNESKKLSKEKPNIKFDYKTISYTLSNTQVPYITISAPVPSKKNIIVLGRQHPGQVWSSFSVQSLMKQLLRDQFPEKDWILEHYTFRIFPMINIDGVIYGNFRCDLSGTDLNRSWKQPNKLLHPHIVAIKQEIKKISLEEQIVSCFDFHSHSKDYNIFAYCCKTDHQGRILPLLISQINQIFYFPYCTFGISKYKESTARAVIYQIAKAPDVLTIQSSFYACNNPLKVFTPSVFTTLSAAIIKALKHYYSKDRQYIEAEQYLPKALAQVAAMRSKNRQKYSFKEESGSDSQPQIDEIAITQKIGNMIPKCNIVEQAFGLKQDKNKLEEISKQKKLSKPKRQKKVEPNLAKLARNTISEQPSQKVQKPPLLISRPRMNSTTTKTFLDRLYHKKQSPERANISDMERTTKYYKKPDKVESLQLSHPKQTINKHLDNEFRSTYREKQLRFQMEEVHQKRQEEFPLLCVLSNNKKQAHLQKLRRIHPTPSQKDKPVIRYQPTFVVNKKMDTMQRLRQRQKKSSDLVSSLWKDTLGYNQDGPITHIFYGSP